MLLFIFAVLVNGICNKDLLNQLRIMEGGWHQQPTAAELNEWLSWRYWAARQKVDLRDIDSEIARGARIIFVCR
jgi:hypothetical protein